MECWLEEQIWLIILAHQEVAQPFYNFPEIIRISNILEEELIYQDVVLCFFAFFLFRYHLLFFFFFHWLNSWFSSLQNGIALNIDTHPNKKYNNSDNPHCQVDPMNLLIFLICNSLNVTICSGKTAGSNDKVQGHFIRCFQSERVNDIPVDIVYDKEDISKTEWIPSHKGEVDGPYQISYFK